MLVVEHNLDVVKTADWVIDLGPEGGDAGGEVVVAGTPEQVAACAESHTGRALAEVLRPRRRVDRSPAPGASDTPVERFHDRAARPGGSAT